MPFATRADLLKTVNVHKLGQLAVPTDMAMPDEEILRVAIVGGDLGEFTEFDQDLIDLALVNIDQALVDASELIVSYGIPANAVSTLITRYTAQVTVYLLAASQDSVTEQLLAAYNSVIKQLQMHARGEINLLPDTSATPITDDVITITSAPSRYIPTANGNDLDEW